MKSLKKVLVCPLDWGLGHASRDIYIVRKLLKQGFKVFVATAGLPYELIKEELPEVEIVKLPAAYKVQYSKGKSQVWKFLLLLPAILFGTLREHLWLQKLVKKHNIDIVISDNRFGLWSRKAYSIYITHQLVVKLPVIFRYLEGLTYFFHKYLAFAWYDRCWIPDNTSRSNSLTGDLSHSYVPSNAVYIGAISKLMDIKQSEDKHLIGFDAVVILSGPEPQKTIFEKIVVKQLHKLGLKSIVIKGQPSQKEISKKANIKFVSHISSQSLKYLLNSAKYVVSRAGYTTVMDLIALQKNAILVPTTGQTEQEYLAKYLGEKGYFVFANQYNFNLKSCIKQLGSCNKIEGLQNMSYLKEEILRLKSL